MSEESWHEARLIPTSGINGADEQERRATSALLAVMSSVREFGRALTQPIGAPAGGVETYIEVPFVTAGRKCFPDGLIRVKGRQQRTWVALVEVKTGGNRLEADQLATYLDVAREQKYDALVTISNEIPAYPGQHPTTIDKRKLKSVSLHHFSWSQILAEAVLQKEHRGVADPDQAWILGELIRYLEHPRSGALEFDDMGSAWVPVRDALAHGTLRAGDAGLSDVATKFDALLRFASLRLGRRLGTDVVPNLSRKHLADTTLRTTELVQSLLADGVMSGGIRVPDAIGPIGVRVDLRSGTVTCHVDVDAPREGRPTTRVNWLVRQLRNAPEYVRMEASTVRERTFGAAELLAVVRDEPAKLVPLGDKELRAFRVAVDSPLGTKRGRGKGGFIDSVLDAVDTFYVDVAQGLRAWSPTAVRIREEADNAEPVSPALVATSISSQDGPAEVADKPTIVRTVAAVRAPTPALATVGASAPASASAPNSSTQVAEAEPGRVEPGPVVLIDSPAPERHPSRRELRIARTPEIETQRTEEPAWLQDPSGGSQLRWWTGSDWSQHVYPLT